MPGFARMISSAPVAGRLAAVAGLRIAMVALAVVAVAAAGRAAAQQEGKLAVELNKLAQEEAACRLYFLLENASEHALDDVTLEFAFFDAAGIFAHRNLFSFGKLPAGRRKLASFPLEGLGCAQIGRVLLNDATRCGLPSQAGLDCDGLIALRNRTDAEFVR